MPTTLLKSLSLPHRLLSYWIRTAICVFATIAHEFVGAPVILESLAKAQLPTLQNCGNMTWNHGEVIHVVAYE
jgi:hypothetical protein